MTLGFLSGSRNFWKLLWVPVKSCFCTDMIGSIECLSPAPRLRIDDCFEIRICHWRPCDLLLSSHQKFQHEVRLCQNVFSTGPLWCWSSGRSRNFGLEGTEYKHCAYPNPHVSWIWALKTLHEKNWRECLRVQDFSSSTTFSQNSCNHSGISKYKGSLRSLNNVSLRSFCGSFRHFTGLINIRSLRSFINRSGHNHWRDVTFNLFLSVLESEFHLR